MHEERACELPMLYGSGATLRTSTTTVCEVWPHVDYSAEKARSSASSHVARGAGGYSWRR